MIRQTCLSSHFGVIGQQLPAADASFPVINRTFAQPQAQCKVISTILSACHPSDSHPANASIRAGPGEDSHRLCYAAGSRKDTGGLRAATRPGPGAGTSEPRLLQMGALLFPLLLLDHDLPKEERAGERRRVLLRSPLSSSLPTRSSRGEREPA